ncbi:hypothetical protein PsorP6_003753 [Peronosclerospora sorghi]|uniref:Uncharacterized protein n=1 Tax=Peronosclerospora sorghi TaxID=230839 RepID=A0ACC0VM14_9STRA|nr:hypothetical protein PsorP6_003753 [Peronosclerospora sorghi]
MLEAAYYGADAVDVATDAMSGTTSQPSMGAIVAALKSSNPTNWVLRGQLPAIKRAYSTSNLLLGDIIKVTPSSKVVGDFAQFIVQNNLTEQEVIDQTETLSLPKSVIM